jgi:hypothetical protein
LGLTNKPYCFWEQVSFVLSAELLTGNAEGRAWDSAGYKIDAAVCASIDLPNVTLVHMPSRAIESKRRCGILIDLDRKLVLETCLFQTQRLAARAGANLEY